MIGPNGAGKTTVGRALEIFQKIARGTNRVGDILSPDDLPRGHESDFLRLEIEAEIDSETYLYAVAFEYPNGFRELRIAEEKLSVGGRDFFTRVLAQVKVSKGGASEESAFGIDWHMVALPIIQYRGSKDHISIFKEWLANALILRPIPQLAKGISNSETLHPDPELKNFGEWFSGLLLSAPSSYGHMDSYLKEVMLDFQAIRNKGIDRTGREIRVDFSSYEGNANFSFEELSDGEKCFLFFAMVIASNRANGPLFCYWDEPDTHLASWEIGPSIMALRQAFRDKGQLLVASHNPEVIRHFSDDNTVVLSRRSHRDPTRVRMLEEYRESGEIQGNFIDALVRGDVF
ncbi:hypothetical protein ROR02_03810 [Pararhodospirillum oryzae]|uniref:ATPase AAA-type core domain-containing protein n=1 Tax=Pararhodospirillum oryzae TaxID=478448 RepID=A0A512H4E5_9PROT|nr:hypothetical protein ROR02_03810 [Pararhodospirillum oryzae]